MGATLPYAAPFTLAAGETMKKPLWIIITVVVGFLGFMIGYSVPPFMEVGFGGGDHGAGQVEQPMDQELMKQYQDLYKQE